MGPTDLGHTQTATRKATWPAETLVKVNLSRKVAHPLLIRIGLTVEVDADGGRTLVHRGVLGSHVVALGLIWEHLLRRPAPPYPWEPILVEFAAKAEAAATKARRDRELADARWWGGRAPSERVRSLPANAWGLARMDRELLDALERAAPQRQREVAIWAARRACAVAGLDTVDWIADALAAVECGEPAPPPFDDTSAAWDRLFTDRLSRLGSAWD